MELAEFLAWPGDGNRRYQLRDGVPVAMNPPAEGHQILVMNIGAALHAALVSRPPCTVRADAGLRSAMHTRSFHQADLVVTCAPAEPQRQYVVDPILIVEVLSPSTADDDRLIKVPDYRLIPSVQEILLIELRRVYAEVHRRQGQAWLTDLLLQQTAVLVLHSVAASFPLEVLYRNVPLEAA